MSQSSASILTELLSPSPSLPLSGAFDTTSVSLSWSTSIGAGSFPPLRSECSLLLPLSGPCNGPFSHSCPSLSFPRPCSPPRPPGPSHRLLLVAPPTNVIFVKLRSLGIHSHRQQGHGVVLGPRVEPVCSHNCLKLDPCVSLQKVPPTTNSLKIQLQGFSGSNACVTRTL